MATGNAIDPTSLETAKSNLSAYAQASCDAANAALIAGYKLAMANYNYNVDLAQVSPVPGHFNYRPAPTVPMGYVLETDLSAFAFGYKVGTDPVCDVIPTHADNTATQSEIQAAKPANTIDIGKHLQGAWYSLGSNDTFPVGKTTPPMPDGHVYQKFGAFAPGTGWYLQVS